MSRDPSNENPSNRQRSQRSGGSGGGSSNGRSRISGPNGLIKPPTLGGNGGNGNRGPSAPSRGPNSPKSMASAERGSSDPSRSRVGDPGPRSRAASPDPAPNDGGDRSFSKLARDRMASASRSLRQGIQKVGESFSKAVRDAGRMEHTERGQSVRPARVAIPPTVAAQAQVQETGPYKRSRARIIAAKWRRKRVKPNAIGIASIIAALSFLLLVVVAGGGFAGTYSVNYYNDHRDQVASIYNLKSGSSTIIYDRNGTSLYVAKDDNSSYNAYISYGQINPLLIKATLDTEDHSFFTNVGIDFYRTLGALVANAKSGDATGQGGSTITQQLVRNIVLQDRNKTALRKVNEMILAYGVTLNYDKKQILEMYLNSIEYGQLNEGVEIAARRYFGLDEQKDANGNILKEANQQLDLAQIAILVGLPNAPSTYDPTQFSCSDRSSPCTDDKWDKPCLGDLHNLDVCDPNPKFNALKGSGHEWLVYRRAASILRGMVRYQDITQADADKATAEVHTILVNETVYQDAYHQSTTQTVQDKSAPFFVDWILKQLATDYGIQDVARAGLRVYTTLDYNLQQYSEKQIHYYMLEQHNVRWPGYPGYCAGGGKCQQPLAVYSGGHDAAMVAEDQRTGDILALVGTSDYGNTKDPKIAGFIDMTGASANTPRSMGSSTKALVYATAFQMGWTPGIMMQDQPTCWDDPADPPDPKHPEIKSHVDWAPACDGWYSPRNYNDGFSGREPIRLALANSLNVPAEEAMSYVGSKPETSQNYISMTQRLGIDSQQAGQMGVSTALGTQPIKLIQMTGAFATFGNNGARAPQRSILRIEAADGTVLYQAPAQVKPEQVLSPQADYMLTSVLSDNVARTGDFKFNNPLYFPTFPVAAKTGTSQGTVGPKDILTLGYSPWMALGVWMGNADNSDMQHVAGITGAGYIFADVMQWAHDNYKWPKVAGFPIPANMARAAFNCQMGLAPFSDKPDTDCQFTPATSNGTNVWSGYAPDYQSGTHAPNEEWYIQGQAPLQS